MIESIGGKGAENSSIMPKEPFRCKHRWALVSNKSLALLARDGDKPQPRNQTLFIQSCRRCGTFRASLFSPASDERHVYIRSQIRYLKGEEGLRTVSFEPVKDIRV